LTPSLFICGSCNGLLGAGTADQNDEWIEGRRQPPRRPDLVLTAQPDTT